MLLTSVELCLLFSIGYVTSTEQVLGFLGCAQELPAETEDSRIPNDAIAIFWGRQDIGGNFLRYILSTNETSYLDVYNATQYAVNTDTYGLIVMDITADDGDIYTRSVLGATDLEVNFTVVQQSPEDLNNILVIYYHGKLVTSKNATLVISVEDTEPLWASTSGGIENAGNPTLVWVDAVSGANESPVGTTAKLNPKPGIFFVKSSLCNIEAISFNITVVYGGDSTTHDISTAAVSGSGNDGSFSEGAITGTFIGVLVAIIVI